MNAPRYFLALMCLGFAVSCNPLKTAIPNKADSPHKIETAKDEKDQWDLTVFDPNFDLFLRSFAKPESMYTEAFLKTQNQLLVSEWNNYYNSGRFRNLIESSIDYDPHENYGKDFEYKLYQVFVYMYRAYGLRFTGINQAS